MLTQNKLPKPQPTRRVTVGTRQYYDGLPTLTLRGLLAGFSQQYENKLADETDIGALPIEYLTTRIGLMQTILTEREKAESKDPVELRLERQRRNQPLATAL